MRTVALERSRATVLAPRLGLPALFARRMCTALPTSWNSTSVLGSSPDFSRSSIGIVTWPFVVTRMCDLQFLLVRVGIAAGGQSVQLSLGGAAVVGAREQLARDRPCLPQLVAEEEDVELRE